MSAYQTQYYSTTVMFQMAAAMHAASGQMRAVAKSLHGWLEKRHRAAVASHEFERMSDHSLRDIGLSRADVLRASLGGVDRSGDPLEAMR